MRAGSLKNKIVVITGASAGLGATLAVECAQQGARLVLLARNAERLEVVGRECEQLDSEVLTVVGDVAVAEDGRRLVEAAVERFGRIDYLVANAGISMWTEFAEIEDVTLFRKLIEVNYLGAVHCVHPALPHLKKSFRPFRGRWGCRCTRGTRRPNTRYRGFAMPCGWRWARVGWG
ncbi:MAG: SDR family NAD(P)-dependent oxidoreductase [Candidatus Latescibacteria bacterium]|nr:SDR family NAD(P)-dependent oxidoreductase [Candidatus Latescibacterota bacterium]